MGKPFIRNYTVKDYNAGSGMYDVIQDQRGVMYFANTWNVRIYDGVKWSYVSLANQRGAFSFGMDEKGVVYVGGLNDLGYLEPSLTGQIQFVSLASHLPKNRLKFGTVRKIIVQDKHIYFATKTQLMRWDGQKLHVWALQNSFHGIFQFENNVYVNIQGLGLHKIEENDLRLVDGGERFSDIGIVNGFKIRDDFILVCPNQGLFRLTGSGLNLKYEEYDNPMQDFLKSNQILSAKNMGEMLAFGTSDAGVAITDLNMKLLCFVDKTSGLLSNKVNGIFQDKDDIIWLGLDKGTAKVEIATPINRWDEGSGVEGYVYTINRHEGVLYIGTTKGIHYLKRLAKGHSKFIPVAKSNSETRFYSSAFHTLPNGKKQLVFAASDGFYEVKLVKNEPKLIKVLDIPLRAAATILPSIVDSNRYYLGNYYSIQVVVYENGKWKHEGEIEGIKDVKKDIIAEDFEGRIWIITYGDIIRRFPVKKENGSFQAGEIEIIDKKNNLPSDQFTGLQRLKEYFVLNSELGTYVYNEEKKKFQIAKKLGKQIGDYFTGFYFFEEDVKGNLWYLAYQHGENIWHEVSYKQPDGSFLTDSVSLRRVPSIDTGLEGTLAEDDGVTWFGGTFGMYRYDVNQRSKPNDFQAMIRRVIANEDSTVFFGSSYKTVDSMRILAIDQAEEIAIELPYEYNSMIFNFASNNYFNESDNEYHFLLEKMGDDKKNNTWSEWDKETKEHIRNLEEGRYVFRVKARNIYGIISSEADFSFKILPPWYRTIWAYMAYSTGLILLIWLFVWFNTRRLKKQKVILEETVRVRTEELTTQTENLQSANEEISSTNEILAQNQEELLANSEEIERKNESLEVYNKHVTDSINYASRIQKAILGEESQIQTSFKESFVLFKPKDIVSGDFYWFGECSEKETQKKKKIIIAADCTGHGVPGAFMTVLGSSLLNEIVNSYSIVQPDNILYELDKRIVAATHKQVESGQAESNVNDGMDMLVVVVDNWNAKLQFSGAKNPLYRVRNGEIEMFKGSKFPIGSSQFKTEKVFDLVELEMLPKDRYYMSTDGFQDQFGGLNNSKFLRKRFRELLLSSSHLPMQAQKELLNKELSAWQGNMKQTDDILLVGFEV
ncbi:MAG: serine phosphatase RsbU (regulator of sigma subunit) [Arenicella sp.]